MTAPSQQLRVILGATCSADAEATLALATELAVTSGGAFHGLLIENEEVIALCRAPSASIVGPAGTAVAGLSRDAMADAVARDAARFERLIAEAAERSSLRGSFSRQRGQPALVLSETARPNDILVVPAGPFRARPREVILVISDAGSPALSALARGTADRLLRPLRTIALSQTVPPGSEDVQRADTAGELLALLARLGPGSLVFGGMPQDGVCLLDLLQQTRCTHVLQL